MRAVIQRVSRASVTVDGDITGEIGRGYLILLGVGKGDDEADCEVLAAKIVKLRLFEEPPGKMNLSLAEAGGGALVVSQFTLLARCDKGNRPSFDPAEAPDRAEELYEKFVASMRAKGVPVETGRFGAYMDVELVNDGPVTIVLDSADLRRKQQ
ncbi:MAG: D-tyrosyl-tRNA(Tyr) deacylase [Nitrospirae bacterium]|nr:D-tyrosyl-tRNA(Tyr) deacylase [Nitrospirota bacterium]